MNTNRSANLQHISGFSLIELLIAIALVGLLTAIAMPGYREHMRRGAVEEAHAELMRGKVALEQYFLDNRTYKEAPCPTGTARFTFTCELEEDGFTITAKGSGNVSDFEYTINEAGAQTSTAWGTTSKSCWIIKKGGSCGG